MWLRGWFGGPDNLVNFEDDRLKALRYLLRDKKGNDHFRREDIIDVAKAAVENPAQIQLVDFVDQLGLESQVVASIRQQQEALIPLDRHPYFQRYERAVGILPTVPQEISLARMNPFTQFETSPPLLFGMGGGSRALNKGLPMDILSMVLTAEKLRREIGLGRCRVICANEITYTNIPNNPAEFSKESIDRVMATERDLLQLVVERFGIADHWDIFLESDIEKIIGTDLKEQYDQIVSDADAVPFIGGHHFAMEMAQMYTLVNQDPGGVKLGWYMRPLNKRRPEYIMDEQPFDARYALYLAFKGLTNKVSIPYAHAGVKLLPDQKGMVNREPPYICYDPADRILLSPFEDPAGKLREATQAGGGLGLRKIGKHFERVIGLFQEIVLGEDFLPARVPIYAIGEAEGIQEKRRRVRASMVQGLGYESQLVYRARKIDEMVYGDDRENYSMTAKSAAEAMGRRLQFILDYVFDGNRKKVEEMYKQAFPKAHDYK